MVQDEPTTKVVPGQPSNAHQWRSQMKQEAEAIRDRSRFLSYAHYATADPWNVANNTMMVAVPLLAALSGFAGLADLFGGSRTIPGALALASAVVGAAAASLRKATHIDDHFASGKAYFEVAQSATAFIGSLPRSHETEATEALKQLYKEERSVLSSEVEPVSTGRAAWAAKPTRYPAYREKVKVLDP